MSHKVSIRRVLSLFCCSLLRGAVHVSQGGIKATGRQWPPEVGVIFAVDHDQTGEKMA